MRNRAGSVVALVLCVLSMLAGRAAAQPADRFAGITPKMQEFVDRGEISGIVTLVADREKVLHLAAVGKSDLATGRKMETSDIFWIASMSKPITATCIGILKDDGKLSFDDPVSKYLPEFSNMTIRAGGRGGRRGGAATTPVAAAPTSAPSRPITLRDVMTHTSGLGEMTSREGHLTLAQTSELLGKQPLGFEPGSRWNYSTAGIDILGRVVEVVSGMPFDRFLQTRVLDPLEMKDTSFWVPADQQSRYARSYVLNATTSKLEETTISYLYNTPVTDKQRPPLGGAGLFSTAEDIARFYQMTLNKGSWKGKQIIKPQTLAEMTRNQIGTLTARPGMPWGYGFCVIEDPSKMEANTTVSPGTFGHGGAFGTSSWADPTTGIVYVQMLQRNNMGNPDNSPMHQAFNKAVAEALAK